MSTTAAGLQRQLDALSCFCERREVTVNLTKSKVVIIEACGIPCINFVFNGDVIQRQGTHRFISHHAQHELWCRCTSVHVLVSAVRKAVQAMRRRFAYL